MLVGPRVAERLRLEVVVVFVVTEVVVTVAPLEVLTIEARLVVGEDIVNRVVIVVETWTASALCAFIAMFDFLPYPLGQIVATQQLAVVSVIILMLLPALEAEVAFTVGITLYIHAFLATFAQFTLKYLILAQFTFQCSVVEYDAC